MGDQRLAVFSDLEKGLIIRGILYGGVHYGAWRIGNGPGAVTLFTENLMSPVLQVCSSSS